MTTNESREIVRRLTDGDPERDFPCFVRHEDAGGPCTRTATTEVYGLPFCEEHGEECAAGALEEMHQEALEFFERFDNPQVPELSNSLVLRAVRGWELTLLDSERFADAKTDDLLLAAFPFREDRVIPETAGEIAGPIPGQDPPYDAWRRHRYEMHGLMRHAYRLGLAYVVETLEAEREVCGAQCAFALALMRGDHPEVLERAHRENVEDARKVAEHFAQ